MVWLCGSFRLELQKKPLIMGILNVTPDSFSDGYPNPDKAMAHAEKLIEDGADIIDVGGESTRPGSQGVCEEEELSRILPVIERLAQRCDVPISVDTQKVNVARRAIVAGASIVNHVSGTLDYEDMIPMLKENKVGYIAMHMPARPDVMQEQPSYYDVMGELTESLGRVLSACAEAGIVRERVLPDPGIGFGKTLRHNLEILRELSSLSRQLGRPILMGLSRKSWLTHLLGTERSHIKELDAYTAMASSVLPFPEVAIHRVHNVKWFRNVLRLKEEITAR